MNDKSETVAFTASAGMGSAVPDAPPEYAGAITAFGFPTVLKRLHKSIRACINRIPRDTADGQTPLRDEFLKCLALDLDDQQVVDRLAQRIGFGTAREDLIQKRINNMTPLDYISPDKALDTPDQASVSRVRDELLRPDRERFAKVQPTRGREVNEWDFMRDEDPNL